VCHLGCRRHRVQQGRKASPQLEADQELVVNATNFDILCAGISNNTNDWVGHFITLRREKGSFRRKLVHSIRVSVASTQPKQTKPEDLPFNDEIPDFA
jgi:hypothetical protein